MQVTIYGIPNCDTVRKARTWLELVAKQRPALNVEFHDVRNQPVSADTIAQWLSQLGPETVINKRSTSWRQLSAEQQQIATEEHALALLQQHPTLMKRPLLAVNGQFLAGFVASQWQQLLDQHHD